MVNEFLSRETENEDKGTVQRGLFIQEISECLPHTRHNNSGGGHVTHCRAESVLRGSLPMWVCPWSKLGECWTAPFFLKSAVGRGKHGFCSFLSCMRSCILGVGWVSYRSSTVTQCLEFTVSTKKSLSISSESNMTLQCLGHAKAESPGQASCIKSSE